MYIFESMVCVMQCIMYHNIYLMQATPPMQKLRHECFLFSQILSNPRERGFSLFSQRRTILLFSQYIAVRHCQ